ncbi:hypothetical protein F5Y19DRAFT_432178 [Xylariaceae sp. FL1651]|nr:hypothetical protein F5Y19DRAFT_432178 [Xylariaceae sp. FL1651]
MHSTFLALIVSAVLSVAQDANSTTVPQCADSCITQAADNVGCDTSDLQCLCDNSNFGESVSPCLVDACDATDINNFEIAFNQLCAGVGSTPTSIASENNAPTATDNLTSASPTSLNDTTTTDDPAATLLTSLISSTPLSSSNIADVTSFLSSTGTTNAPGQTQNAGSSSSGNAPGGQTSLPAKQTSRKSLSAGATAGIAVGGVIVIATIIGFTWFCIRKSRAQRDEHEVTPNSSNLEPGYIENEKPELPDSSVAAILEARKPDGSDEKALFHLVTNEVKTPQTDTSESPKSQQKNVPSQGQELDTLPLREETSSNTVSELASYPLHTGPHEATDSGETDIRTHTQELDISIPRQEIGGNAVSELALYPQYTQAYDAPEAITRNMNSSLFVNSSMSFDAQTLASHPGLEVVPQVQQSLVSERPEERNVTQLLAQQQRIQEEAVRLRRLQALAEEERRVQEEIERYMGGGQRN